MPLQSMAASGGFGKTLTFSTRKSGPQVRFQKKQKDVITAPRTAQRNKFLIACAMWPLYEVGICECGYFLLGGQDVRVSDLPEWQKAPQFARYVSDVINYYC